MKSNFNHKTIFVGDYVKLKKIPVNIEIDFNLLYKVTDIFVFKGTPHMRISIVNIGERVITFNDIEEVIYESGDIKETI